MSDGQLERAARLVSRTEFRFGNTVSQVNESLGVHQEESPFDVRPVKHIDPVTQRVQIAQSPNKEC